MNNSDKISNSNIEKILYLLLIHLYIYIFFWSDNTYTEKYKVGRKSRCAYIIMIVIRLLTL